MITFGSLFAGIGGFDLGLERAGMACKWQVEIDNQCRMVLAHHWPDTDRSNDDVRECGQHNLEPVDLIAGGFPCQDLSVAGRREGLAGSRSGLWTEFARVLEGLRPRWVIVENVAGLLSSNERRDMGILCGKLAQLGYWWAYRVLDAEYFGVAQRRRRVFIVGNLGDRPCAHEVLFEREGSAWDSPPSREAEQRIAATLTQGSAAGRGVSEPGRRREDDVNLIPFDTTQITSKGNYSHPQPGDPCHPLAAGAHPPALVYQCHGGNVGPMGTIRSGNGGLTGGVPFVTHPLNAHAGRLESQQTYLAYNWQSGGDVRLNLGLPNLQVNQVPAVGVRRLTPTECERLQGFPDGWTAVNGMSDAARYYMLGNAVCVLVAEWIGRRIVEIDATCNPMSLGA